ncbi:hypothetical protein H4J38_01560 [Colwellia sp. BRX10-3]|uniref:hypothetical protein n=1 Tax=Colwellia sp. BRX10-3 TaxID=2759844 RepID=UPI0015F3C0A8|nr:hypothetical protein [Colwellia sp. BRX10-3]MBA6389460.1 hypothetical protein [Colwellia sp. BRX10-3]
MVLNAVETLDDIIGVSEMLLKLLVTSDIESTKSIPELYNQPDESPADTDKLWKLIAKREKKIHQLFENFSSEELQLHQVKLQTMAALDTQLVDKVNRTQKSAKSKILKLKQNKKAISLYQKL